MDQFGPMVIPQPEHGAAVGAKVALARADLLLRSAACFDGGIFPSQFSISATTSIEGQRRRGLLDQVFPFLDLQTVGDSTQIDTTAVSANFTTDTTGTELIWDGRLRVECEFDPAALTATFEFPDLVRICRTRKRDRMRSHT